MNRTAIPPSFLAGGLRMLGLGLLLALLGMPLAWAEDTPTDPPNGPDGAAEGEGGSLPLHGSVGARYRLRVSDSGEDDHDLYEYLRLLWRDDYAPGLSASFYGRMTQDLDGMGEEREFLIWNDITDAYDTWINGRIYHAYATYRPEDSFIEMARVGRQQIFAGETYYVDGGQLVLSPIEEFFDLGVHVFGGVPTHRHEASIDGDWILGGGISVHPWEGGHIRVDYTHVEDENRYYGDLEENRNPGTPRNDLITLAASQSAFGWLNAHGEYQWLDGDPREMSLGAEFMPPDWGFLLRGNFRALFNPEEAIAYDLDPFFAVALDMEPYWKLHLAAVQRFGEHFDLEAGVDFRQVFHQGKVGRYNREFERYYATFSAYEFLVPELSVSLTGEFWDVRDEENTGSYGIEEVRDAEDSGALGIEFEYDLSDTLRLRAGTDYAYYKIDFFTGEEKYDAQGYYVRGDWRPADNWLLDLSFRLEHDDYENYGILRTGFRFDF